MNLRYISIWLSPETGLDVDYRYAFKLRTRYISNYLSRAIRKYKVSTDGTFNMISVEPHCDQPKECDIVPDAALLVEVPFDQSRYEKALKDPTDCEYYLELLEEGFRKASHYKEIPLDLLLQLISEFRAGGCKNEWRHKKKQFREQDIDVALDCYFTSIDFRLVATITRISTKEELCSGIVIRTEPDEIVFEKTFRDILVDGKNITITDGFDSARIRIRLPEALNKKFKFVLLGPKEMNKDLSYSPSE